MIELTAIEKQPEWPRKIKITDLIGMKDLVMMHIFTFSVDPEWLVDNLHPDATPEVHIFHGMNGLPRELDIPGMVDRHVSLYRIWMPSAYGTHHSKIMILWFKNGSGQVVVHTANLEPAQWRNVAQAVWRSPLLVPENQSNQQGESCFKADFLSYLRAYNIRPVTTIVNRLKNYNFGAIDDEVTQFIGHIPGNFDLDSKIWGLPRLAASVSDCPVDTVVAQVSSIGQMPPEYAPEFAKRLNASEFKIVFPTVAEVAASWDGYAAGGAIFFNRLAGRTNREKQYMDYRRRYFCRWSGPRCRATPHIKTYVGLVGHQVKWYLMTSANFSKPAWGVKNKSRNTFWIQNYECGILIRGEAAASQPLPYALPLEPYRDSDDAWSPNIAHVTPDCLGNRWPSNFA